MSSIAHRQPRTGRRNFNLRAYLAGTAATAALIGAVVLAFASLGAYVAFNGLPIGGTDADVEASVAVGPALGAERVSNQRGAQQAGPGDVRRDQGSSANSRANDGPSGGSQASATAADTATPPASAGDGAAVATGGAQGTTAPTPVQAGPSADPPSSQTPSPHVTAPNVVGGTVGNVEQTLQQAGVDVPVTGNDSAVEEVTGLVGGN